MRRRDASLTGESLGAKLAAGEKYLEEDREKNTKKRNNSSEKNVWSSGGQTNPARADSLHGPGRRDGKTITRRTDVFYKEESLCDDFK